MKTFKEYYTLKEAKGAFKEFSLEQQPIRIPVSLYPKISSFIETKLKDFGDVFIPSTKKSVDKPDTGDIDVIIHPNNRQTWREDLERIFSGYIIAKKSNGPQLMTVMKNLVDDNQYMVDFILASEGSFEYRKMYSKFGTLIPVVVGSFARSLRYKFDQNSLYLRLMSDKGNYHNIPLTNDFATAMKILMLDMGPVNADALYEPEQVANWVISSPRFDSKVWSKPPSPSGQEIVTKNVKSHRALKARPEVSECYSIIDNTNKSAIWDNTGYKIERQILGDQFVDKILEQVRGIEKSQNKVISGHEIMQLTGIKAGPSLGKIIKYIQDNELNREEAHKYLKDANYER